MNLRTTAGWMWRLLLIAWVAGGLGACAGKTDSPLARQCAMALELAEEDVESARGIEDQGALSVMRASHSHGSAVMAQRLGKYESCIEKANRARQYVREAYPAGSKR